MNWYLKVLKNYAVFNGRARRKEYWMFSLFNLIFLIIAIILDNLFGTVINNVGYGLFYFLYTIAVLIPSLAVSVRRLHDVGKSGWFLLIVLIPIIGSIWLLVLLVTDGDAEKNKYGDNPKANLSVDSIADNAQSPSNVNDRSTADTLIILVVIWMFVVRIFWTVLPKLTSGYYSTDWFKVINSVTGVIWAFIPLGLAFAVKNKSGQLALFIIGGIYLLIGLYGTVSLILQ